jgi:hypothetical protein
MDALLPFRDVITQTLIPLFQDIFEGEDPADDSPEETVAYAIDLIGDVTTCDDPIAIAIHDIYRNGAEAGLPRRFSSSSSVLGCPLTAAGLPVARIDTMSASFDLPVPATVAENPCSGAGALAENDMEALDEAARTRREALQARRAETRPRPRTAASSSPRGRARRSSRPKGPREKVFGNGRTVPLDREAKAIPPERGVRMSMPCGL